MLMQRLLFLQYLCEKCNMKYIGVKFGKLTVLELVGTNKTRISLYKCLCDCGNHKIVKSINLRLGETKSCGCLKTGKKIVDLSGKKYGLLTIIRYVGSSKYRESKWLCKCDCGNEKIILSKSFISEKTKSCGCLHIAQKSKLIGVLNPNYNFDISDYERLNKRDRLHKEWALNVKILFNWKCDNCDKNSNLEAHHLNGYNWDKENRINVKNGVCLCKKCHKNFHKIYGYKNVTEQQYLEFKNNGKFQTQTK